MRAAEHDVRVPVERRYQTFWPRFWAGWIDTAVLWPVGKLMSFVYVSSTVPLVIYFALVLDSIVFLAYSVYLHGRFGQTIGKWIMKVQVMDLSGARLTMRQAILRDGVLIVLCALYLVFAAKPVFSGVSPESSDFARGPVLFLTYSVLTWTLLELGTMLTNERRRAIHDLIAGSVVVRRSNSSSSGRDISAVR